MPTWFLIIVAIGSAAIAGAMAASKGEWARTKAWSIVTAGLLFLAIGLTVYAFFGWSWYIGVAIGVASLFSFLQAGVWMMKKGES